MGNETMKIILCEERKRKKLLNKTSKELLKMFFKKYKRGRIKFTCSPPAYYLVVLTVIALLLQQQNTIAQAQSEINLTTRDSATSYSIQAETSTATTFTITQQQLDITSAPKASPALERDTGASNSTSTLMMMQFGRRLNQDASTEKQNQQQLLTGTNENYEKSDTNLYTTNAAAKGTPILRPSLEEVASKLSRKHLNLEHENWRLKQHQSTSPAPSTISLLLSSSPQVLPGVGVFDELQSAPVTFKEQRTMTTKVAESVSDTPQVSVISSNQQVVEEEQEIKEPSVKPETGSSLVIPASHHPHQPLNGSLSTTLQQASVGVTASFLGESNVNLAADIHQLNSQPYLLTETGTLSGSSKETAARLPGRQSKRKMKTAPHTSPGQLQQQSENDRELYLCHQYLQRTPSGSLTSSRGDTHNSAATNSADGSSLGALSSISSSVNPNLAKLVSSQLLPCTCESRVSQFQQPQPLHQQADLYSSIWLSCDNVQLINNHFFTTLPRAAGDQNIDYSMLDSFTNNSSASGSSQVNDEDLQLTSFSQREAGLQTLHSQKFHYLHLSNLRSIDLSSNRIRQIKMDAFHGLELKLENLDLSNNLLGDSRAVFDGHSNNNNSYRSQRAETSRGSSNADQSEKIMFASDELNRLRKLKWLSLRNNQISQLGVSIFIKQLQVSSSSKVGAETSSDQDEQPVEMSDLSYLDLSENLLRFVPGESIKLLSNLKSLNLMRNRIIELDQTTKFPKSLRFLDLSENLIRSIRQCNLIDLPDLIDINLSNNQLSQLDKTAFVSAQAIVSSLSNNLLLPVGAGTADSGSSNQQKKQGQGNVQNSDSSGAAQNRALLVAYQGSESDVRVGDDETKGLIGSSREDEEGSIISEIRGKGKTSAKRRKRAISEHALELDESTPELSKSEGDSAIGEEIEVDDLVADDSILSSIAYLVTGKHDTSEDVNPNPPMKQFNSTLRLNLSYNFLENIPGDSLLKFPNLQQLDLSYNRIRQLDPNYLCSIYNLVENLRHLDLSGNLLSIRSQPQQQNVSLSGGLSTNQGVEQSNFRQLNKLFGCLQKLEKLSLSENRLAFFDRPPSSSKINNQRGATTEYENGQTIFGGYKLEGSSNFSIEDNDHTLDFSEDHTVDQRLVLKFGEGFASKTLNSLDLSDNQLKFVPIIEYISSPISTTSSQSQQLIDSRICIEVLNLNYNSIERFEESDLENLRNLRELYLDYNKISALPVKQMRKFTSLDRLSLEGNRITSLASLNELFERTMRTLRVLNLANNRLTEWPEISRHIIRETIASTSTNFLFSPTANSDNQQQQVAAATVTGGATGTLAATVFALEELNLEGNLFTSSNISSLFEQMIYMKSLGLLNLNHNLLTRIRSEWFKFANKNLQTLLLSGNRINNIDLGAFAGNQVNELTRLNLDHNLLKELKRKTFDSMPKIRELNLANNLIHTIKSEAFYQLTSLQVLKLNNNKLSSWKCEYFSHLCNSISGTINADLATLISSRSPLVSSIVELDLSHNSLSQLRTNSIAVHTRLTSLNLSNNKLSFIPHDLFKTTTSASSTGRQIQLVSSLRYLNLANNHIQTIDNINTKPLKNLIHLDLSYNELQTLGVDVVSGSSGSSAIVDGTTEMPGKNQTLNKQQQQQPQKQQRSARALTSPSNWPALGKLRHLNLANNQLTLVNQSLLSELSPFVLLNLNLSSNYLDSESLPNAFYSRVANVHKNYDLVFTLKLESLDLSHNRMSEFPAQLLDNHYTSMESCNLSHNRIQSLLANSNLMIQIKSLNLEFNPLNRESNELVLFEQRNVRSLNLAATRLFAIQQVSMNINNKKEHLANQTSQLDLIRSISKQIDAPYLRHLNLSSNQLVWLAANIFDKMHSLQTLDLSNNQLTRLHLLNNQLLRVSPSLEYLNIASNLFTSVDQTDFTQLISLRHLDLSNLLSLQRMNCRFLSKLTTLKSLRMIHYPSLRQSIQSLIVALNAHEASATITAGSNQHQQQYERIQKKIRNELLMSTIGKHCFKDDLQSSSSTQNGPITDGIGGDYYYYPSRDFSTAKWFNLEDLEIEVFNNFSENLLGQSRNTGGGFDMTDELSQLLGPKLRYLSLIGLNLTSMADNSFLGITSNELRLKVSYTSLSELPLKQIVNGVTKRTKLSLDFRNNNIQSIDTINLQLLDELNDQVIQRSDHNSLKLGFNPIRCDCQARPLWLWLNQRWNFNDDQSMYNDGTLSNSSTPFTATTILNHWLKFRSISQTSDLKCYYPFKLRGKLTSQVSYNDLVCKGTALSNQATSGPSTTNVNRHSRNKKNETTRSSDSYYAASLNNINNNNIGEVGDLDEQTEGEDEYQDLDSKLTVVETKFNRHRPLLNNYSHYFLNSPILTEKLNEDVSNVDKEIYESKAKRLSRNPLNTIPQVSNQIDSNEEQLQVIENNNQQQFIRPQVHRRHLPFQSLNILDQITSRGKVIGAKTVKPNSMLTDIDVIILTVLSITMAILSFVIITICLIKYKMDKTSEEELLDMHKKMIVSRAMQLGATKDTKLILPNQTSSKGNEPTSSNSSSSKSSDQNLSTRLKKCNSFRLAQKLARRHVLVPIVNNGSGVMVPATENFLMRSPTIRRMQGMANNASDWFKFTLRTYPSNNVQTRRKGLFAKGTADQLSSSQLTTSKLASSSFKPQKVEHVSGSTGVDIIENNQEKGDEQSHKITRGLREQQAMGNKQLRPPIAPKPVGKGTVYSGSKAHQVRPMRTFGSASSQQPMKSSRVAGEDNHQKYSQMLLLNTNQSQIPSNDVEGRFAYQSDSQADSFRGGETPISRLDDHQDVFILVQDDSQQSSSRETPAGMIYSQSSSPVAYGFLRDSPSITTVSSTILQRRNNNNNNDTDYSLVHKQENVALVVDGNSTSNNRSSSASSITNDEQVIISRL